MSDLSRRSLLQSIPGAASAIAVPAVAVQAAPLASAELHDLWNKRRALRAVMLNAAKAHDAAYDAMPWWAQVGPSYLLHDGTLSGPASAWPAIVEMEPSKTFGAMRRIRFSPADLKQQFTSGINSGSHAIGPHRRALRALALRVRAQKIERARYNIEALGRQTDAVGDQIDALTQAIIAHGNQSADAIAARLLIGFAFSARSDLTTKQNTVGISDALLLLRPKLTGNIAADVADLLDNPNAPSSERMAWM